MASTSAVRDEGVGHLQEFIRAVQATRERLEGREDLDAVDDGLEAAATLLEVVEGVATIGITTAEHMVTRDLVAANRDVESLRSQLSRTKDALRECLERVRDERDQWDAEEAERVEQLGKIDARLLENLTAASEALAELHGALFDLEREDEEQDTEVTGDLDALGQTLLAQVAAAIEALEPPLEVQDRVKEANEKAKSCQMIQSIVLVVVAVIVAVIAVLAAVFTGGASLVLVLVAVAAVVAVVETVLSEESIRCIVAATAVVMRMMGLEEAADRLCEGLQDATAVLAVGEAMAEELAPMLPHVSVVHALAEGVERMLSALNPFD